MRKCVLDNNKICDDCLECSVCPYHDKICDNCFECLEFDDVD